MAARTGAAVERIEVAHLGGEERPLRFRGLPRYPITAEHQAKGSQACQQRNEMASALHGVCSCSGSTCGVSRPARTAIGQVCIVSIRSERAITKPPIIPKATCEAMNQRQSICWFNVGLITSRKAKIRPVHMSGVMSPPQNAGWRGSMGNIAEYSRPTRRERTP